MKVYILLALLFYGCAGAPKFQKLSNGSGYTVTQLPDNENHLQVIVSLPGNTSDKALEDYAALAIGEECSKRGFSVWDYGRVSSEMYEGLCYKINEFKGLGLSFYKEGLVKEPRNFIVEKINDKPSTKFLEDDEVLAIDDKKISSMAQIKSIIYSKKEATSILVSIKRKGKVLNISEPLVAYKDLMLDKKNLTLLREKFN